ncbi:MAG: hypothetical protein WB421_17990, partial [Terriglobales bacterium]
DKPVLLGDFNARVGNYPDVWFRALGRHGHGERNEAGVRLLEFCVSNDLAVANSFFRHQAVHKTTWQHSCSRRWHVIDYIVVNTADLKFVLDVRVRRSADCFTDHNLLVGRFFFPKVTRPKVVRRTKCCVRFNVSLLEQKSIASQFCDTLSEQLRLHPQQNSVPEEWSPIKSSIFSAASEVHPESSLELG